MEQIKLKATLRDQKGKSAVKKMRHTGLVPAVVYHRGEKAVAVTVPDREISKIVHAHAGENILISLMIDQEKKPRPHAVIIKEIQHDPVKRTILHVDFNEISLTEKITVDVEIVAVGESVGVKQDGGLLDHPLRELKIRCLPTDIPKHIEVDVAGLKLNDSVHVRDIKVSDKIEVLTDPEALVFQVKLPVEEKVEEAPAEAAAEPEVIREKKEEGAPAEAEKKAEKPAKEEAAKPEKKE